MLTEAQLQALLERFHLSASARQIVQHVRNNPPSRRVRAAVGNVTCLFPSVKMGVTIQAESHTVEFPFLLSMETDSLVHEFYDQPPSLKLAYRSNGRQSSWIHTPDFFRIGKDWIGWVECKPEKELERLSQKRPWRFEKREDGKWRCPPGEEYAAQFGLAYHVWSSSEIDWKFHDNILLLQDYMRPDVPPPDEAIAHEVLTIVTEEHGITLAHLLERVGARQDGHLEVPRGDGYEGYQMVLDTGNVADVIYTMIVTQALYVDLHAEHLADAWRVHVFRDRVAASTYEIRTQTPAWTRLSVLPPALDLSPGAVVSWNGQAYQVINRGEDEIALLDDAGGCRLVTLPNDHFGRLVEDGKIVATGGPRTTLSEEVLELRSRVSTTDEAEANRRFALLAPVLLNPGSKPAPLEAEGVTMLPLRTARRLKARYKAANQAYGCGYDGLLPLHFRKGNRNPKLPEESIALAHHFIAEKFETLARPHVKEIYGRYLRACDEAGIISASYITFCRYVKERPLHEQERKRKGSRGAYKSEPWYWHLERTTPQHGNHPFHIVHIDHTQDDVELICAITGTNLGRPWSSIATDAFAKRVLAVFVSFDRPDTRTCMMLMREIVRRHRRVPQVVVVDGGKEFHSTYFDTLLARLECVKKQRPGKPRFGSVIERIFGTTNTEFFHNLKGNTQITRDVRQMTKAVNPKALAVWNLEALYYTLCEYCYEIYDTTPHPTLGCSPREAVLFGEAQFGARLHRRREYDDEFVKITMPTTDRGTAKVQISGVKLHHIYYWSDAFREPGVLGSQVEVRYDPYDAGLIYARANGRWVGCHSEHYSTFRGRSQREVKLLTEALRDRYRQHGRQFDASARKLADFLDTAEGQQAILEQHLKDQALRPILTLVNSAASTKALPRGESGSSIIETDAISIVPSATLPSSYAIVPGDACGPAAPEEDTSMVNSVYEPQAQKGRASGRGRSGNQTREKRREVREEPSDERDFIICEDF